MVTWPELPVVDMSNHSFWIDDKRRLGRESAKMYRYAECICDCSILVRQKCKWKLEFFLELLVIFCRVLAYSYDFNRGF